LAQPLILALDIGTSSVRAALYDYNADVLPRTMVKNERLLEATDEGGAEIDADLAFKQAVAAVDDVLKKAESVKGQITHVATSCFWHSLLGIDAKGRPTTKVLGWADTRSREQVTVLRKKLDETALHNRTGARFHSSFWPSKLLWLRQELGSAFNSTSKWISLSDYVLFRLTGELSTSISMASGTGVFDQRNCTWDSGLLRFLKLDRTKFPSVADDGQAFRLTSSFAKRWPRLGEAQWLPAIGDGAANNLGADCATRSRAALMVGTSGAMRVAYEAEPPGEIPPGLWCYRIDRKRVIIGGATSDGGGLYRWLKDNLKLDFSDDQLEAEIGKRKPAGHELVFLPFLAGERSTGYHENAHGAVIGLHSSTDSIDIVQAALESVAYRFADIFDQLKKVVRIKEVVASGGALRESPLWTQMIADVLSTNLSLPPVREASSRGAVLLALEQIGHNVGPKKTRSQPGRKFRTNKKRSAEYKVARRRHAEYYRKIIDS
jgi:gluconokinase